MGELRGPLLSSCAGEVHTDRVAGWDALRDILEQAQTPVRLTWAELDRIVGGLPPSAADHRAWWSGDRPHVRVWRSAGYAVSDLVMGERVAFVRAGEPARPSPKSAELPPRSDLLLVTCVKAKLASPAPAKDLYVSPLFRKQRAFAESRGGPWFILSAEHGLVAPGEWLAPYERYLPDTPPSYRAAWGSWVVERLELLAGSLAGCAVEVHAGAAYTGSIDRPLAAKGAVLVTPLEGLTLGERLHWYDERAGAASAAPAGLTTFVDQLRAYSRSVTPDEFLASQGAGSQFPGLYSWWVDADGASDLSRGLGSLVPAGLIYAGLAGATRWPSGKRSGNTLWARISGMHLGGSHEFSTFRKTLGSILAGAAGWDRIDETALTAWMRSHLRLVAVPCPDPDSLGRLEEQVLAAIDPPLNLQGMVPTPVRQRLKQLRKSFR